MVEYCENCRHSELSECGTLYCEKHEEPVNDSGYCDEYYRDLKIKDSCNACSIIIDLKQENAQLKQEIEQLNDANFINLTEASRLADKEHEYLRQIRQLKEMLSNAYVIMRDDTNPCECDDCLDVQTRMESWLNWYDECGYDITKESEGEG